MTADVQVRSKKSNATQDDSTVNTRSVPAAPKLKSTSSVQTLQSTPSPAPQPVQSPAAMAKKRGRPKGKSLAAKTSKTPKTANKKASSGKTLAASVSDKSMDVLTSSQFAAQHGLASDNYSVPADGSQLPIDPRLLQSQPLPSSTAAATHSINPLQYASSGPSISDMLRPPMSHTSSTVTLQLQEPSPYQSPESSTASKSASQQLPTPYPTPVSMRTADLTPSGDRPVNLFERLSDIANRSTAAHRGHRFPATKYSGHIDWTHFEPKATLQNSNKQSSRKSRAKG